MNAKIYLLSFVFAISSTVLNAENLTDYLIPIPKKVEQHQGIFTRSTGRIIVPAIANNENLRNIAGGLQLVLSQMDIETSVAAKAAEGESPLLWAHLTPVLSPEAYRITIHPTQVLIEGGDEAGIFYALQSFKQIARFAKEHGGLPLIFIEDAPDFKRRGVMLDVSRNKVPEMHTLKRLADLFAGWKINEIQLYTENTFAYQNHSAVWEGFSPMTAGEILELDQFCRERFIDLVPNQTSFGHMNQWLTHDEYKHLGELSGSDHGHVISPAVPGTLTLMSELFAELLPNFSSRYFNINCDETESLGNGRSKELVEKKGKGRVYLDYLLQLKNEVDKHNRTTLFWGDIILHHTELIPELPKDMIALVWGYEADHPFDTELEKFYEAGCPFYVCPGTSSWNSLVGRNRTAFDNLKNAAVNGMKYKALGFLNTDWGDGGHWQPLPVSYAAFMFGAAVCWGVDVNEQIDIAKLLSLYVLNDPTGQSGQALVEIGEAYLETNVRLFNTSLFNNLLRNPEMDLPENVSRVGLQAAVDHLTQHLPLLLDAPLGCDDAQTIKEEMKLAVDMAILGCEIGLSRFTAAGDALELKEVPAAKRKTLTGKYENIIERHKKLWTLRNRRGGLHVSVQLFEKGLAMLKE